MDKRVLITIAKELLTLGKSTPDKIKKDKIEVKLPDGRVFQIEEGNKKEAIVPLTLVE